MLTLISRFGFIIYFRAWLCEKNNNMLKEIAVEKRNNYV